MRIPKLGWLAFAFLMFLGGCAADSAASGYLARDVAAGLSQPTQMVMLDDGRLLVAQLSGAENDKTGSVVAIDPDDPAAVDVWFDELDKPTGLAVIDDTVWIMERRKLSRGPTGGGDVEVVLPGLEFNGRSEGTLTERDGLLIFNTSGRRDGSERREGSATIWTFDPATETLAANAVGLQNAYARVIDDDGTMWSTDLHAGSAESAFADSLVRVRPDDDFLWPRCTGGGEPEAAYGGDAEVCADRPPPVARFAVGATPTSIDVAPWNPDLFVVALWSTGEVVLVPRPNDATVIESFEVLYDGFERPQHVLTVGDEVWIADHATGRIVAIAKA